MSTTTTPISAIGIIRVSKDGGRKAAGKLHSDENQREQCRRLAELNGLQIVDWIDEIDVSGGTPLDERAYGAAIARVENPRDPVGAIVFAHSDRHDRELGVNQEAIKRIDAVDGVLLAGSQRLTHKTPEQWLISTQGSMMNHYQRLVIGARIAEGVEAAVAAGRVPYPSVGLGFVLQPDNTLKLADEATLAVVREAFAMRASGAAYNEVRAFLASRGHVRSYQAVRRMMHSPLYIGEIRYGGKRRKDGTLSPLYVNSSPGFDAIVDRELWDDVQAMRASTGRHGKSERLLARQDVLHCGGCGGKMIAGTVKQRSGATSHYYRCGRGKHNGCPERAAITAVEVERLVSERAREILCDAEATETAVAEALDARAAADAAERKFKRARRLLVDDDGGAEDEDAEQQLDELRADWQSKLAIADELENDCAEVELVNAARDWDRLLPSSRRRLIRAAIRTVKVRPGRGGTVAERCTIEPKRKQTASLGA